MTAVHTGCGAAGNAITAVAAGNVAVLKYAVFDSRGSIKWADYCTSGHTTGIVAVC